MRRLIENRDESLNLNMEKLDEFVNYILNKLREFSCCKEKRTYAEYFLNDLIDSVMDVLRSIKYKTPFNEEYIIRYIIQKLEESNDGQINPSVLATLISKLRKAITEDTETEQSPYRYEQALQTDEYGDQDIPYEFLFNLIRGKSEYSGLDQMYQTVDYNHYLCTTPGLKELGEDLLSTIKIRYSNLIEEGDRNKLVDIGSQIEEALKRLNENMSISSLEKKIYNVLSEIEVVFRNLRDNKESCDGDKVVGFLSYVFNYLGSVFLSAYSYYVSHSIEVNRQIEALYFTDQICKYMDGIVKSMEKHINFLDSDTYTKVKGLYQQFCVMIAQIIIDKMRMLRRK